MNGAPLRTALAALAALSALAGCKPVTLPPPVTGGDGQEIRVEAVPTRILVGRGGIPLGVSRAPSARPRGGGSMPCISRSTAGTGGSLRAVIAVARRAGVDPLKIHVVPGSGPPGSVEVIAARFAALAPVCPSLAIVEPSVNDNDFEPTLGCSTRRNLAAMVNDPADLLGSDAVVPSDGAYAARGIERYRDTKATLGQRDAHAPGSPQP